jgi:hypothetical protein
MSPMIMVTTAFIEGTFFRMDDTEITIKKLFITGKTKTLLKSLGNRSLALNTLHFTQKIELDALSQPLIDGNRLVFD